MFKDFLFFKQKTAYEMRISDWSSDVCSSDLRGIGNGMSLIIFISILSQFPFVMGQVWASTVAAGRILRFVVVVAIFLFMVVAIIYVDQTGGASCGERVCQ